MLTLGGDETNDSQGWLSLSLPLDSGTADFFSIHAHIIVSVATLRTASSVLGTIEDHESQACVADKVKDLIMYSAPVVSCPSLNYFYVLGM